MVREYSDWIAPLQEEFGDDLRMAAKYTEDEYSHLHRRDDIQEKYELGEMEDIRHELIALGLTKNRIERVAHAGECNYLLAQLDDASIFVFPESSTSGRFVSIEADAEQVHSRVIDSCLSQSNSST